MELINLIIKMKGGNGKLAMEELEEILGEKLLK